MDILQTIVYNLQCNISEENHDAWTFSWSESDIINDDRSAKSFVCVEFDEKHQICLAHNGTPIRVGSDNHEQENLSLYFLYVSVFVSESVIVVFVERHHICLVLFRGDGGRVRQQ